MKNKNRFLGIVMMVVIVEFFGTANVALFAQTAPRSWYVSAAGNDENNGRSEEQAFKTLEKALHSAQSGTVKTITIVGEIEGSTQFTGTNTTEILITGKDENASINRKIELEGNAVLRFENIRFAGDVENTIQGAVTVTFGKGVNFPGVAYWEAAGRNTINTSGAAITLKSGDATVIMEGDSKISHYKYAVKISAGTFIMKDNAVISEGIVTPGYSGDQGEGAGIFIDYLGIFIMQGNAQINGRGGRGIFIKRPYGDTQSNIIVVLKENASITGNSDGGVSLRSFDSRGSSKNISFTMQDNASITNNSTDDNGGGIYINEGTVIIKGNAVISGNKAAKGGGVYFAGKTTSFDSIIFERGKKEASSIKMSQFTMQENATITNNTAKEGGGVYAEKGTAWIEMTLENPFGITGKILSYRQLTTGFVMEGGTISGNKADFGAGVYALYASLRDEEVLVPNATTRSDPFRSETGKKIGVPGFTLSGGSITGNAAEFVGGGVYVKEAGAFSQGKGTISDNTAGDGEGEDIYQPQ